MGDFMDSVNLQCHEALHLVSAETWDTERHARTADAATALVSRVLLDADHPDGSKVADEA